jgi:hypothetical protein
MNIQSREERHVSELMVVPFDDEEGRTTGDSSWNPEIYFPYEEGMTVEDVKQKAVKQLMKDWKEEDCFDSTEEFIEEYDLNVTGGWVVEKATLDIINAGAYDVGGDSALYAMIHSMKCQVQAAAKKTIE